MVLTSDEQIEFRQKSHEIITECGNRIKALCDAQYHASWVDRNLDTLALPNRVGHLNALAELDDLYTKYIEDAK